MKNFAISKMSCGHCVNTIETAINALPGVTSAQANLATKTVAVTGTASAAEIVETLSHAGYEASEI